MSEAGQTPASVATMPTSPNFVLSDPGSIVRSDARGHATAHRSALQGGADATRSICCAGQQRRATSASGGARPGCGQHDDGDGRRSQSHDPAPRPEHPSRSRRGSLEQIGDDFNEVMAYPKIDLPMYKPLATNSVERLLPNINLIAHNSITLIETNQRFIEAYMVGLNHEFARKLLWREYPTDQRGSYFRQFWAVDSYIDSEGLSHDALQEKLYDIPEIHRWPLDSNLGRSQQPRRSRPAARAAGRAHHSRRAAEEVSEHGDLRAARRRW